MNDFIATVRSKVGPRTNLNPRDIAGWLVAPFILAIVIPTNEKIARNAVFFAAHGVSTVAWIIVLTGFLVVLWLIILALLGFAHRKMSPSAFDYLTSTIMFVTIWFLAGNLLCRSLFDSAPALGPIIGLPVAVALTLLSRRLRMGTVLVVFAAVAAIFPLIMTQFVPSDASASALKFTNTTTRPNIVWVISDELQYPLEFDEQGKVRKELPNLASLQGSSTTYTHAYAAANYTDYAVPSQLTGIADVAGAGTARMDKVRAGIGIVPSLAAQYSVVMESPIYHFECDTTACASAGSDEDSNLFTRYLNFAKDSIAVAGRTALAPPFYNYFPSLDGKWRDFWSGGDEFGDNADGNTVIKAISGINNAHELAPGRPLFAFWHTIRTHAPWSVDREGKLLYPSRLPVVEGAHMIGSDRNGLYTSPELESVERRLYANSVVDFDRQLGELIATLKADGLYDNTMIIVTADHGAGITVSGDRRMGDTEQQRWTEVAHVPLMIKNPNQVTPDVVRAPRSVGQIAQTVVDTAGATTAPELTLAPNLGTDLAHGPVFTTVAYGGVFTPWVYQGAPEPTPWVPDDLTPPDPAHPFAIGIDLGLLDKPVPTGWSPVNGTVIDTLPGESDQQVLVVDRATSSCPKGQRVGLVSSNGKVIGSVLWEQGRQATGERTRGWAIVPKSETYDIWCHN